LSNNPKIKELPQNLKVVGNLNIHNTEIHEIPIGLQVGGTLDIRGSKIESVKKKLLRKVGKILKDKTTKIIGWI
jgi:hypothetical protein